LQRLLLALISHPTHVGQEPISRGMPQTVEDEGMRLGSNEVGEHQPGPGSIERAQKRNGLTVVSVRPVEQSEEG
jgi:hypothetical protein